MVEHRPKGLYERFFKRLIDIVCSFTAIVILSPLMLLTALLVRIYLGKPVLYVQERPGRYAKIFKLRKFRSMKNTTDQDGNLLSDEERLTSFGRMIRSTSLDELPELFCILKGDMSFVGPRPLLTEYLPYYTEQEMHRHDVRPGLTGLAQVNGRNSIEWTARFKIDLEYVNNITFLTDVRIVLKTFAKVIRRSDVADDTRASEGNFAEIRKAQSLVSE